MIGYKHVSFNRGTAKRNTSMIVREYQRVIEEHEQDLVSFDKKKYEICLNNFPPLTFNIFGQLSDYSYAKGCVDYKQLKFIVKEIEEKESESIEKLKDLESIKEEYSRFCKRFIKRFNCR